MKRLIPMVGCIVSVACTAPQRQPPAPPGFWFDGEEYLSTDFLAAEPSASCEVTEHGWTVVGASLPDGSWFKIEASPSAEFPEPNVALLRGWQDGSSSTGLILYSEEGIVRSVGSERQRSFGLRSQMGVWMADVGRRALGVDCASLTPEVSL